MRVQGGAWDTPGTAAEAAAVAAVVAAHLLLPLLLCWAGRQRRSRLWRSGFISVARLMMLTMVAPNFSSATFLRKPPLAGAAALLDAPRVLMGARGPAGCGLRRAVHGGAPPACSVAGLTQHDAIALPL